MRGFNVGHWNKSGDICVAADVAETVGRIAPRYVGTEKGSEINGEYCSIKILRPWSSQEAHDILQVSKGHRLNV